MTCKGNFTRDTIYCGNALTGTTNNGIINLYIKYSRKEAVMSFINKFKDFMGIGEEDFEDDFDYDDDDDSEEE